jgi:signal transduction histidine kinase/ActR/RegA family two-component response regulator
VRPEEDEEKLLRAVAIENSKSILLARQRAEEELIRAKEALEQKTEELAHSLSLMRATLDATTDGILVTDEHGKITDYNKKFTELWRISPKMLDTLENEQQIFHVALCHQLKDPEVFLATTSEIYDASPPESFDLLHFADGRVFERFSRIQFANERNVGRVWSFRDITQHNRLLEASEKAAEERKQLLVRERAARSEAEHANAMKDEFLATLSHELRTPLGAIIGWALILRRNENGSSEFRKGLEVIERNARAQTQLIEDLLDMSRIISGKIRLDIQVVEPFSFIEAAIETVRPAADAKEIRLDKLLDLTAGPIWGDPNRLQQIVWNLLSNAIKFTPKGGVVQIVLRRVDSHVEISVADSGIGIKPGFLPHVFERFRQGDPSITRPYGGLGLGLSIVKHLTELLGGTVEAASQGEGCGSTFSVNLPLLAVYTPTARSERVYLGASPAAAFSFEPVDLSGIKILIVDDEADARDMINRVLEDCKAKVITAASATEALMVIESERPHVLVSDIGMPEIDGYEFLRRVRALTQKIGLHIPAVALTAYAGFEDKTRALRAGFLVHLAKPVEPSELVATLASLTGRAGNLAVP